MTTCTDCSAAVVPPKVRCPRCARGTVAVACSRRPRRPERGTRAPLATLLALDAPGSRERYAELAAVYEKLPAWQREIVDAEILLACRRTIEARDAAGPPPAKRIDLAAIARRIVAGGIRGLDVAERRAYWRASYYRKKGRLAS